MIGEIIGQHYEVTELLGAGSMGEVYKGWDRSLGRPVAIKVLKPDVGLGTERFRTEAKILASVNHGNICQVFSLLEHRGRDVMVLQHLDGAPLDSVLTSRGRLPWSEVRSIAADVLAGLTEAHHAKVVHRDLKPANLMRVNSATGFKTVIMDFGIARAQGQARATREGMVACTIEYASPEQIQGEDVGPASDLYSLAMVLYELLTGVLAFSAKTDAAWAHAHVYEEPDWNKVASVSSKQVAQFLRGAVEKNAVDRYPSAHAMLHALQRLPDTDGGLEESAVSRLVSSISQTLGSNKTPTQPRVTTGSQPFAVSRSQPKPVQPPIRSESTVGEAETSWRAGLKEHWALVFLGLMVLLAIGLVALSRFDGSTASSVLTTSRATSENASSDASAASRAATGSAAGDTGNASIASPVPATATLEMGAPTVVSPTRSSGDGVDSTAGNRQQTEKRSPVRESKKTRLD